MVHGSLLVCAPAELRLNLNYRCRDCLLLPPPQSQGFISWLLLLFYSVEKELQQSTVSLMTPKKHVTHYTNLGCQLLYSSAYSFYYSLTLVTVSISTAIWAITVRECDTIWDCIGRDEQSCPTLSTWHFTQQMQEFWNDNNSDLAVQTLKKDV